MSASKDTKRLAKIIAPFGLTVVRASGHSQIFNQAGRRVYTFSSTPNCPHFAEKTLKDLIRFKLVPASVKQRIR